MSFGNYQHNLTPNRQFALDKHQVRHCTVYKTYFCRECKIFNIYVIINNSYTLYFPSTCNGFQLYYFSYVYALFLATKKCCSADGISHLGNF
jgi:hypothetical protein